MRSVIRFTLAVACLSLSGISCPLFPQPPRTAGLKGFSSADELRAYLADQATSSVGRSTGGMLFFDIAPVPPSSPQATGTEATDSNTAGGAPAPSPDPFSTTNVQESGVDESDLVKNNGQTIFALDGDTIHIIRATPAESVQQIAKLTIPSSGDSLYLHGNTLIAISRQYGYGIYYGYGGGTVGSGGAVPPPVPTTTTDAPPPPDNTVSSGSTPSSGGSAPSSGDVKGSPSSDPGTSAPGIPVDPGIVPPDPGPIPPITGPKTIATFIDVSDPSKPTVQATLTFDGDLAGSRLIGSKLHLVITTVPTLPPNPTPLAVESMTVEQWIPDYKLQSGDGTVVKSGDVAGWQSFFRPDEPNGYGIVTIVTVDTDQPTAPFASTAISANTGIIYASTDSLYLTDTQYAWDTGQNHEDTIVHKLAFTDSGTDYKASGLVPGRPLNSYSLGEFEGYLRIATTVSTFTQTGGSDNNSVYVLREDGESLATVGKIEQIATGEQIYAARFIGNRGFLVTFHRVDPLFTIDLSDPTNPKLAGELKVPGYSDHIQLLDDNHLLTIGKAVDDTGQFAWIEGVQLSIFDVTDPANPQLLHKETIGGRGTSSEANYNPKAFNYFAAKNALAFPIDLYGGETIGPVYGSHEFTGLYVYHVTVENGFEFLGRIESSDGVNNGCYYGYFGYTRGVFIGDDVYSVTQTSTKAASLDDVSTLLGQTTYPGAPTVQADCFFEPPVIALPVGDGLK